MIGYFFFFQAEDGIRDTSVTGVQTCALPICAKISSGLERGKPPQRLGVGFLHQIFSLGRVLRQPSSEVVELIEQRHCQRSEERRVGKECRSRWEPTHWKKKDEKK